MIVAVAGSRKISADLAPLLEEHLPVGCSEIITGGAEGTDKIAGEFAKKNSIKLTEIIPDYERFGKSAPLRRNREIVDRADYVLVFWDGKSRGTRNVIITSLDAGKPLKVIPI